MTQIDIINYYSQSVESGGILSGILSREIFEILALKSPISRALASSIVTEIDQQRN
jgi:hypothetical protein